jgi:hypothetical protein
MRTIPTTPAVPGAQPSAASTSVVLASDQALPLPTGAATAANQPALNGDGGALAHVTNFPATQVVSGTVTANVGTTGGLALDASIQALITAVEQPQAVTATALPLPTGAATAANQATGNTALSAIETSVAAAATAAGQTTANTALAAIQTATAAGATAANQVTGNTSLTTLVTAHGASGTGITAPTGGSGMLGWLSGIYQAVLGVLSVYTKNVQATGTLTAADPTGVAAGSTVTINTDSLGALGIKIAGNGVGTVLFQGTIDGTTWDNPKAYPLTVGSAGVQSTTTIGDFEINCAAFKQFRVCLSALTSGTFAVTFNGTASLKHIGVKNGNAVDLQATVVSAGTPGTDFSANAPTIPGVGLAFAATGTYVPYASYVLVATVPASVTRNNVDIENASGGPIAVVRDDGTAIAGATPTNASVFPINGGAAPGSQGGSWSSQTFKGRLQIYAPSSTANVTVMVD